MYILQQIAGLNPEFLIQEVGGGGAGIQISNQFPGEADAAFLDYKALKVRSKNSEKGKTDAGEEE